MLVRGRISGGIYWKTIAFAIIAIAITLAGCVAAWCVICTWSLVSLGFTPF